jgi:Flp pilus assembly pilin Flp
MAEASIPDMFGVAENGRDRFDPGGQPPGLHGLPEQEGGQREEMRNQGSSATLIELALIIVLIAIVTMAILLIMGDDLRLWIVNTLQGLLPAR